MKPEVVVFLVVNLLSFRNPVMLADTVAAASLAGSKTNRLDPVANNAGWAKVLRPVGTEFEVRRKRSSPPDDAEYRASAAGSSEPQQLRRLPMFESGDRRLAEPNIAEQRAENRRTMSRTLPISTTQPDVGTAEIRS